MLDVLTAPRETSVRAAAPGTCLADSGLLHWILRVACACEFGGHGAFGIITKAAWVPYFGVIGIPPELAWKLMPVIGSVDMTLGLVVGLLRPARFILLYMAFWGLVTATIRPLAGEPIWEFVERVPNWAVPLAFFGLRSMARPKPEWLRRLTPTRERTTMDWLLRVAVAGALIGHGAYGAILAKASWFGYFAVLGLSQTTVESLGLLRIVGGAEMALGLIVLVFPVPALLVFAAAWKIFTELLRPAAGEPFWEFIERASNMIAPLALLYVRGRSNPVAKTTSGGGRDAARPRSSRSCQVERESAISLA
jgi:hypothetical protein